MIPPNRIKNTYKKIARRFIIVVIPATTQALVPGPVIKNASIDPLLAPADISDLISGIEVSPLI